MRPVILYVIGAALTVYGFYVFWRDSTVNQNAFVFGAICLASAAGLQIIRDLWRRLRR
jgi:hypothetical protein